MEILMSLLTIAFAVYIVIVMGYILLENRSPQSTFAWLLLFMLLPIVGLIIYYFFGRSWKTFAKENELAKQDLMKSPS